MSSHLFILGTFIILGTVIIHIFCIVLIVVTVQRYSRQFHSLNELIKNGCMAAIGIVGLLFAHVVEAWVWAGIFLAIGEFETLNDALYFSLVTSTTLGYGDLTLSTQWQLLSTFEAMGGLILFGVTTAFLMAFMKRILDYSDR